MQMLNGAGRRGKAVTLGAMVLAAALTLTACGGGSSPSDDPGSTSNQPGGELKIGIGSEPESLDPHVSRAHTDKYFSSNVFEKLYERNQAGELVPALATSYELSEDGLQVSYELREGVKFHDGSDFTAEDVRFSFERFASPDIENGFAHLTSAVTEVEIVDDHQVIVHLSQFNGAFIPGGAFVPIVPKAYIEEVGDEEFANHPVGTGPLEFVDRRVRDSFELKRFDDYWGEKAHYETFKFSILSDANSRVAAIRSGTVDIIAQVPPQNLEQLESDSNLTVITEATGENVFLKFNLTDDSKPWGDVLVRQALDYAIDQKQIIESTLNGLGTPYTGVAPLNDGFSLVRDEQRPYDPERARELLEEAGYADGFTIRIVGPVNGRMPASEQVVQAIAGYWSEVGVDAQVEIREYSQWLEAIQAGGDFDAGLGLFGDQTGFDPQDRLMTSLMSGGSYSSVNDPVLDELIQRVATTVDVQERQLAYVEAFEYAYENVLDLPLYSALQGFATKSDVCWQPYVGSPFTQMVSAKSC